MKKLLVSLLVVFMVLPTVAQITPIKTEEKPYENITQTITYWKEFGNYTYCEWSNNEYEDEFVLLNIGNSLEEAITSLENLLAVKEQDGTQFELQGYKCFVKTYCIEFFKVGDLKYTAGDYRILFSELEKDITVLKKRLETQK